jgi:hypothetical protein
MTCAQARADARTRTGARVPGRARVQTLIAPVGAVRSTARASAVHLARAAERGERGSAAHARRSRERLAGKSFCVREKGRFYDAWEGVGS